MTEQQKQAARNLVRRTEGLAVWWSMHEAHRECSAQMPYTPETVALTFMGSGASTAVTVQELRDILTARTELIAALEEEGESGDAGRPE